MRAFELRPAGCAVQNAEFTQLVWGSKEEPSDSVISNIGPWLEDIGTASNTAIDLVRLAAAAYMADRQTRRGEGYSRTIRIHVQVTDAAPWLAVLDDLVGLLHWLTADIWEISVAPDGRERPEAVDALAEPPEIVSLLSGGLDSMAGALAAPRETRRLFVGHWDNPTVKASQDRTWNWLKGVLTEDCAYRQVRLCEAASKQETSTRSRCLLFFALAVGIASACGSGEVEVPENGFTPDNALAADPSDANGYAGTGNFAGDSSVTNGVVGNSQRRTLTATNGQVIWDLAGDVWEWTNGTVSTGRPGVAGNAYAFWIEWPGVTTPGTMSPNPFPVATGISGANALTSGNGIGQLISNTAETNPHGVLRGGYWRNGIDGGVLAMTLNNVPSNNANIAIGFRVSR